MRSIIRISPGVCQVTRRSRLSKGRVEAVYWVPTLSATGSEITSFVLAARASKIQRGYSQLWIEETARGKCCSWIEQRRNEKIRIRKIATSLTVLSLKHSTQTGKHSLRSRIGPSGDAGRAPSYPSRSCQQPHPSC